MVTTLAGAISRMVLLPLSTVRESLTPLNPSAIPADRAVLHFVASMAGIAECSNPGGRRHGPKTLKVEELVLDTSNPRVETSKSQHEEIQRLLDDQGDDLLSLAEDILENGLSPIERLLVMQDKDDPEKFAVLEGNRRLLALKVMVNPSLLGGLEVDSKLKKQFEEAASEFTRTTSEQVQEELNRGLSSLSRPGVAIDISKVRDLATEAARLFESCDPPKTR